MSLRVYVESYHVLNLRIEILGIGVAALIFVVEYPLQQLMKLN